MSEHEIRFNYSKAMNQAKELKNVASSLTKVGNSKLEECMVKVSKGWNGDNSESYVKKGKKLGDKIDKSGNGVRQTAEAIETMARNIYNAEMAALRAARERRNK